MTDQEALAARRQVEAMKAQAVAFVGNCDALLHMLPAPAAPETERPRARFFGEDEPDKEAT